MITKIFLNFGFELKRSIQIASLFHTYIDMDERIAGEQDRHNQKFEYARAPQITKNIYIFGILAPGFDVRTQHNPETKDFFLHLYFNSNGSYQIA